MTSRRPAATASKASASSCSRRCGSAGAANTMTLRGSPAMERAYSPAPGPVFDARRRPEQRLSVLDGCPMNGGTAPLGGVAGPFSDTGRARASPGGGPMSIRRAHAPPMLRGLATSAAALATMLALSAPAGAGGVTTLESVASDGTQANGWSLDPSISGDGRSVVCTSIADKLVPGDTNNFSHTFVHTRGGTTERESVDSTESRGGSSARASISDDGRFVAYVGFNGTSEDVIVRDRQAGTVERADVASDGTGGNADGFNVKISGDGRYVAFASFATNL